MGAWITYGLGSECQNLPGFVVFTSEGGRNPQPIASRQWGAGFLPPRHQGVQFFTPGDPVHYVANPPGVSPRQQQALVETIAQLNRRRNETLADPEIAARVSQYELAFRMQSSIPAAHGFFGRAETHSRHVRRDGGQRNVRANCLLARRLVERGVRFHPALPSRLGPSRRPGPLHEDLLWPVRQTVCRTGEGPQAAWDCWKTR